MEWTELNDFSSRELEQFKAVCSHLLSRTFVIRTRCLPGKGRVSNPDYTFLSIHQNLVRSYLGLLDWDLRQDNLNGYFYVVNTEEANRLVLNQTTTAILLALRMIYDENQEQAGLEQDVLCTVRELLEKVVTDYAILSTRPNMREIKRALTVLEQHCVIQQVEGKYTQNDGKFAILPTILTAVSSEKLNAVVAMLRKEEADEEASEDSAD